MIRYYITDRSLLGGSVERLLHNIERNAQNGVDWIQIREKDLEARDLYAVVCEALNRVQGTGTKLLVNDRADIALAAGAHGVHLRSGSILAAEWRRVLPAGFLIGVSIHSLAETTALEGADFAVFGPVFESPGKGPPVGLTALAQATASTAVPLLALGGVTHETSIECLNAGAAGVAGVRLFQF